MNKKHFIIYTFQSLEDPLLKGLMLEYIIRLSEQNKSYVFHLISHEQKQFELNNEEKLIKKKILEKQNIFWHPIKYKTGRFLLIKKLYNFLQSLYICLKIKIQYKPSTIIGFLPIAGGYSYIVARLLNLKLVIFCFEPHSDYMADFNIWKSSSLKYKLLNKFEELQIKRADHIVLPTSYSIAKANSINPSSKKYLVPISVDTSKFQFDLKKREEIRNRLNVSNKTVLIYTGKFGGIYYSTAEIAKFFKMLYDQNNAYFFYIISPNYQELIDSMKSLNMTEDQFFVSKPVNYDELAGHLSAADIGLIAVPTLPSQKYRTPVKTGLYLSCGIPYIINQGVAEDDILAEKENVGVVINNMTTINFDNLNFKIMGLLAENKEDLRARCHHIAVKYRGMKNSVNALDSILKEN